MQIEFLPGLLRIHLQQAFAHTLQYESDGFLTVLNIQGETVAKFKTVATVAYNAQHGTPVSQDGKLVFIGTWKKGLFCYSIKDQKLVWKVGPGRVRGIIVDDHSLLIEIAGRGIYRRDTQSGDLIEIFKLPSIGTFKQLNAHELFAGPVKGAYCLFSLPGMEFKKHVKIKSLNVNNCLSYIIQDIYYRNGTLVVKGVEQYKERNYADEEIIEFERPISLI